mgnify:CR=1 FL=1
MECLNSVQGCNFKTNEEALFKKHAEECDFMWTKCQYSSLGCPYESTKLDVLEHTNSCFVKSVLQSVDALKDNISEMLTQVERLSMEGGNIRKDLKEMRETIDSTNASFVETKQTLEEKILVISQLTELVPSETKYLSLTMKDLLQKLERSYHLLRQQTSSKVEFSHSLGNLMPLVKQSANCLKYLMQLKRSAKKSKAMRLKAWSVRIKYCGRGCRIKGS